MLTPSQLPVTLKQFIAMPRNRMGIEDKSYPMASRIIKDSIEAELIKPYDPENKSRKHAKYIPFWA